MSDLVLVERTLGGDKEAFGALVERYRHQVYALAFHHVRDFEVAQDLAQEAFLQAYLKLAQLREPDRFVAWLRALTTNLCRMWLRRHVMRNGAVETVSLDDEEAPLACDPQPAPHDAVERAHLNAQIRHAIDALPTRQRLAVTMFYIGGLSYQEIAEFLGESVNAVESRLHRARVLLKERMMKMIGESMESHQLPEQFTAEVLKKVQVLRVDGTVRTVAQQWQSGVEQVPTLLMQDEQAREFPVRLMASEALAIAMELEGKSSPRPMTHDLFRRILAALNIKLEQVVLSEVWRGEFQARMSFHCGDEKRTIEARAGDALALAVLMEAEICATPAVLKKARRLKALPSTPPSEAPAEPKAAISVLPSQLEQEALRKHRAHGAKAETGQDVMHTRQRRWARINWEKQTAVHIQGIVTDAVSNPVVLLKDTKDRLLPIWIGVSEAHSIGRELRRSGVSINLSNAPKHFTVEFTHDLIKGVLDAFEVAVQWIAIDALFQSVFFSVVALRHNGTRRFVDARPSDAFALAARYASPIYVTQKLMNEVGVAPQQSGTGVLQVLEDLSSKASATLPPIAKDVHMVGEEPIMRIVNTILLSALRQSASEVRIEPQRKGIRVCYRSDSVLREQMRVPQYVIDPLLERIKIMAGMNAAECCIAQDGHILLEVDDKKYALDVTTSSTKLGEKVIIHINQPG